MGIPGVKIICVLNTPLKYNSYMEMFISAPYLEACVSLICPFIFYLLGSKPRSSKPKREKTKEEKTFQRRAKLFLVAQAVAVVLFLTFLKASDDVELELDDEGYGYDD